MSVLAFKPEAWSRVILAAEKKALVFGGPGIVNDDYEGEISGPGTTVHITQFGDPVISAYTPNETIKYQELDDADKRQAPGDIQSYLEDRAAYKLADTADSFIAGLYTGVASANTLLGNDGSNPSTNVNNSIAPAVYGGSSSAP